MSVDYLADAIGSNRRAYSVVQLLANSLQNDPHNGFGLDAFTLSTVIHSLKDYILSTHHHLAELEEFVPPDIATRPFVQIELSQNNQGN